MVRNAIRPLCVGAVAGAMAILCWSRSPVVEHGATDGQLIAHEWGTFTSVAGPNGRAVAWTPLQASTDLPDFIEHFRDGSYKCGLSETIRMETPVLYFYSPRETTVSVNVYFAKGTITEWYPHANAVAQSDSAGSIRWDEVRLRPGSPAAFPTGKNDSHYYAARNTAATALQVSAPGGDQHEKFLFYRGVSSAELPVQARLTPEDKLLVKNAGNNEIPSMMLIESRGGKLGYRTSRGLRQEALLDRPELMPSTGAMFKELEDMLVARGLYLDEARAMIATWRNSWFEDGSRLLYMVPTEDVAALLPLSITPSPASTVRVFVGRLELLTPETESAVEQAFAAQDRATLDRYRRFLVPVLDALIGNSQADPARTHVLQGYMNSAYRYACQSSWPTGQ